VYYLYYDAHGNQVATADGDGDTVSTETYDPWGNPGSALPSDQTSHAYVGADNEQTDSTTGLILMGARPYDPATGRFLSVDPIDGGSLNNYDYCGQDPIDCYDLSGTTAAVLPWQLELPEWWSLEAGGSWYSLPFGLGLWLGASLSTGTASCDQGGPCTTMSPTTTTPNPSVVLASEPDGEELARQGREILGRGHGDAARARWIGWWKSLNNKQKQAYNRVKGPKPGKRTGR
jgi:RHS repeat-associated protein